MLHHSWPDRPRPMRSVFLLVFALTVAAANARAEHSTAADVPTLTKSVTTGITNPDATNGYFTITVHIPTADTPKIVYVRDDGTLLVGSSPNTGACIGATPWRCRVDAADLVLRISKPLSLATNAPHFCAAGTLSNSASMTDNDGNPIATSNTVELAVPANPDETCGRTVTIC